MNSEIGKKSSEEKQMAIVLAHLAYKIFHNYHCVLFFIAFCNK